MYIPEILKQTSLFGRLLKFLGRCSTKDSLKHYIFYPASISVKDFYTKDQVRVQYRFE